MNHYYSVNNYYKEKFGWKVYKLTLSSGCSCPNRDGTLDTRGCIFCSQGGSVEFAASAYLSVTEQLRQAKTRVEQKYKGASYIAYFQPFSNTYADAAYLRAIYYEAIAPHCVVGLCVATRPDCLPDEIVSLLSQINRVKPVTVELGLQTIHESTANYIRRGYPLSVYDDAVERLHKEGIEVVTHMILGLPGETEQMMLDSVRYVGQRTDGIKLQLLHVIEGTDLAEEYRQGKFQTLTLEAYTDLLCKSIELLPEKVVIHRITGDGDKHSLIAPLWSVDKKRVLNYINSEMDRRELRQGSKL